MKAFLTEDEHKKLSPDLQKEYQKTEDGRYRVVVEAQDGWAFENVTGLRSALESERALHAAEKGKVAKFSGLDPDAARKAINDLQALQGAQPPEKVALQLKALEDQLVDKHGKERQKLEAEIGILTKGLEKALIESVATQELTKPDINGSPALLMPIIQRSVKMEKTDKGDFVVRVLNPDGTPRITRKAGSVAPMEIGEFISEMRQSPDYAPAFKAPGASGSGSAGTRSGGTGNSHVISATDAKDPAKYRAARAEAAKVGAEVTISGE